MAHFINLLILLSLLFSSYTTWFALNEYLRFNFLFIFIAFCLTVIRYPNIIFTIQKNTKIQRYSMFVFLLIVILSYLYNSIVNFQPKCNSNFIATIGIIFILYTYYNAVINKFFSLNSCINGLAYGGLILMISLIVDTILGNFFDIKLHDYFTFNYKGNTEGFTRLGWYSTAGPTEEPGVAAQYLNLLIPFCWLVFKSYKKRLLLALSYVFCLGSLYSSTGVATLILNSIILVIISKKQTTKIFLLTIIILSFVTSIYLYNNHDDFRNSIDAMAFINKVTFSGETQSDTERATGILTAIHHGIENPLLGKGPGYGKFYFDHGYLSTFFSFLGNYGFIAFIAFIIFWIDFAYKCFKLNLILKKTFLFSFISCSVACIIADNLHSFILWILLPIINKAYNERLIYNNLYK